MEQQTEVTSIRLSPESIGRIGRIAKVQHIPLRTLIRSWVMQRLDVEEITTLAPSLEGAKAKEGTLPKEVHVHA